VSVAPGIGTLELACIAVYLVPRTSVLGAILLTGFLGGATATHVRVGDPLFSHVLFPSYVGALIWVGLLLRDPRLRALVALPARGR
jgi:DoxX-like family